jgi:nitric oxide reductase NorE protein
MTNPLETNNSKSIYYPPGGLLIWIIVFLELITFGAFLIVYLSYRATDIETFNTSQDMLNRTLGMLNTLVLLTSGVFMAAGLVELKRGGRKAVIYIGLTIAFGILFIVLKVFEYFEKMDIGIGLSTNQFWVFYWLLTGFHLIHVLVAVVLLSYMLIKTNSGFYNRSNFEDVESVGVFWHMCDLIWIFLFPILYLLH